MTLARFDFTDRVRPMVEIGIGDSRTFVGGKWDTALWDTGRWSGLEPTWFDISCDTRSANVAYGRQAVTDRFVPGMASIIVDNASGWADPDVVDAPDVINVRPGRSIRISVDHAVHGLRVLYRGWIDSVTPVYHPADTDTVELVCVDALGEVNRAKLQPVDPPVGDGEAASARVNRILDAAGWLPRNIQSSAEPLLATDLGGQVADMLGVTADSCGGSVYGDYEGRVTFRARDWQAFLPGTPPDGIIGNVDPGDVCPTRWERPFNRADIATRAIIGRDFDTAVVVDDPAGIALYGIEPFERTDLITRDDPSLTMLANRVIRTRGAATAPRVRSVSLDAATSTAALDLMSTVDVYKPSRYRCRLQYPRGVVFDAEHFATGVAHNLTPTSWTLDLNLDVAAPFAVAGGRWDSAYWDLATWTVAAELAAEARALRAELIGAS